VIEAKRLGGREKRSGRGLRSHPLYPIRIRKPEQRKGQERSAQVHARKKRRVSINAVGEGEELPREKKWGGGGIGWGGEKESEEPR